MLVLVESGKEIALFQKQLEIIIRKKMNKRQIKDIGYPGGNNKNAEIVSNGKIWYWSDLYREEGKAPRYLNWFGELSDKKNLNISVELNTPLEGINNLIASFFAKDTETGIVYLIHTGRVGGGAKGVGKATFWAYSKPRLVDVYDSNGKVRQGIILMPINDGASIVVLQKYISLINSFKDAIKSNLLEDMELDSEQYKDYFPEFRGRKKGRKTNELDYMSWHGLVVDALEVWRKSYLFTKNLRTVKNKYIDLGVEKDGVLVELYEVKTSTSTTSLYTAIGQLMIHSHDKQCKKSILIPSSELISAKFKAALKHLNIKLITYEIQGDKVLIFEN